MRTAMLEFTLLNKEGQSGRVFTANEYWIKDLPSYMEHIQYRFDVLYLFSKHNKMRFERSKDLLLKSSKINIRIRSVFMTKEVSIMNGRDIHFAVDLYSKEAIIAKLKLGDDSFFETGTIQVVEDETEASLINGIKNWMQRTNISDKFPEFEIIYLK